MQASPRFSNHSLMQESTTATGTTVLVRQEKIMKYLNVKVRLIACFAVLCFLVAAGSPVAQAQTPTSGALLKIDGTVGATTVHLTIYDSQIHSGHVQTPPCVDYTDFPTDAYVLQGGSWTGCDLGDAYEVSDGSQSGGGAHQFPGAADLTGTGYSFHIKTEYLINGASLICNTNGDICASPDSGFLTVTNNSGAAFSGTITLQGNSPVVGRAVLSRRRSCSRHLEHRARNGRQCSAGVGLGR